MSDPIRDPEQRADALAKAMAARQARRKILEQVTAGEVTIAAVLARGGIDPVVAKTRVLNLVEAFHGYSSARAAAVLEEAGIIERRRVGGLSVKQRDALIAVLELTTTRRR